MKSSSKGSDASICIRFDSLASAKVANLCAGYVITQPGTSIIPKNKYMEYYNKIISHTKKFTGIFSDNDPFVPLDKNEGLLKEKLGAKTIVLHDKGHFTEEDNVTELPEALEEFLRL